MFFVAKPKGFLIQSEIEKYKEINSELVKGILEEAAKINQNQQHEHSLGRRRAALTPIYFNDNVTIFP